AASTASPSPGTRGQLPGHLARTRRASTRPCAHVPVSWPADSAGGHPGGHADMARLAAITRHAGLNGPVSTQMLSIASAAVPTALQSKLAALNRCLENHDQDRSI